MEVIKKLWYSFKSQPDVWFFYGFFLTFTLSIRKVLFFYPIERQFNEYTGIYLYLSDIFLILTLISWLISILCNNCDNLSIYIRLFNALNKPIYYLPLLFVVWSFISVFWSQNYSIALFRSFKLLELYFLYIYLISSFSPFRKGGLRGICKIIIFLALFQAIIAILQFIFQHSIGIFWLKESLISTDLPGVAKIILSGHKFIRAYGLFPHPNILGGFLVFSILISLLYKRMSHSCPKQKCFTWNINQPKLLTLFIFIQIIGLILTFSKSAILGFIIALAFIYFKQKINVSRGTLIKQVIIISLIILLAFFLVKPDIYSFFIKSLGERETYLRASLGMISIHPLVGIGSGQFVLEMQKYSKIMLEIWQYQPVHNVFLLIWAELGIIGLFIFIAFLWKLFNFSKTPSPLQGEGWGEVNIYLKSILLAFLFIMLFDHYFWDIQQGQIMLWMVMGLIVGLSLKDSSKNLER